MCSSIHQENRNKNPKNYMQGEFGISELLSVLDFTATEKNLNRN